MQKLLSSPGSIGAKLESISALDGTMRTNNTHRLQCMAIQCREGHFRWNSVATVDQFDYRSVHYYLAHCPICDYNIMT